MAQDIGGVMLPVFPDGLFDTYHYGVVLTIVQNGVTDYGLVVSTSPIYVGDFDGSCVVATTDTEYALYACYGDFTEWVLEGTGADIGAPITVFGFLKESIIWANHDIKVAVLVIDEATMNITTTPTDEIAFLDSTIAVPDICSAPGTFFRGIAEEVRRLTGNTGQRHTIDTMRPALKGVDPADDTYKWLDAVTIDSSTGAMSSEAEKLIMPPNCRMVNDVKSADLPNALTIGEKVFSGCANLASVNAPLVRETGSYSFQDCTSLETVDFPNCTYIGGFSFLLCESLKTVNLPAVENLQAGAFQMCTNLTEASFPALKIAEFHVFQSCGLKKIDLGVVEKLYAAFTYCALLEAVILRKTDSVCELLDADGFNFTPIASGTGYIYVPSALVDSYKTATNWSTYANQIRAIEDYPEICGTTA